MPQRNLKRSGTDFEEINLFGILHWFHVTVDYDYESTDTGKDRHFTDEWIEIETIIPQDFLYPNNILVVPSLPFRRFGDNGPPQREEWDVQSSVNITEKKIVGVSQQRHSLQLHYDVRCYKRTSIRDLKFSGLIVRGQRARSEQTDLADPIVEPIALEGFVDLLLSNKDIVTKLKEQLT